MLLVLVAVFFVPTPCQSNLTGDGVYLLGDSIRLFDNLRHHFDFSQRFAARNDSNVLTVALSIAYEFPSHSLRYDINLIVQGVQMAIQQFRGYGNNFLDDYEFE